MRAKESSFGEGVLAFRGFLIGGVLSGIFWVALYFIIF